MRHIYQRYLELGSVVELADELNRAGHRTKVQQRASGPHKGGCVFRRGTLYHLLANRIYLGQMVHKGEHFPAEHRAIVPIDLWDAVQARLAGNANGTSRRLRSQQPSLLVGLVMDGEGRAMTPSHATKPGRRYRYYITRPDQLDGTPAWRVSAHDLEQLVCSRLSELLADKHALCGLTSDADAEAIHAMLQKADLAAATLRSGPARERAELLAAIITRIDLGEECIEMTVDATKLAAVLGLERAAEEQSILLTLAAAKVRRGHQLRLVIPGPTSINPPSANRDPKLFALIAEAHAARQLILANPAVSIAIIAASNNRCRTRLGKLAALACIAPDIVTAIVEGRQPPALTATTLLAAELPLCWKAQRATLGFS